MTQKFLDLFFKGKWHNYGHVTMCFIVGNLFFDLGLSIILSSILSMLFGALIEFIQWIRPHDTGFNLKDLLIWDLKGVILFIVYRLILSLIV